MRHVTESKWNLKPKLKPKNVLLNCLPVLHASAKTGLGVAEVLGAVVDKIPPPDRHGRGQDLRLLLQDSWYDKYKGTVNLVQVQTSSL